MIEKYIEDYANKIVDTIISDYTNGVLGIEESYTKYLDRHVDSKVTDKDKNTIIMCVGNFLAYRGYSIDDNVCKFSIYKY